MIAASSKGIGLATAQALAQEGCQISMCSRNEETLEKAAGQVSENARTYVVDVTDSEDLTWWYNETVKDFGQVDILVTNTGGPPAGVASEVTDDQWKTGVDSTLLNIVRLVRLVTPGMQKNKWGRIVHITSLVARQPNHLLAISSTLRSGIMALTRLQADELGPHGITVNGILPGHTLTDRQVHLAEIRAEREDISVQQALSRQGADSAIGRLATPEEIAAPIAFLCSQQAAYITGTSMLVDGGVTRGLG